MRKIDDDFVHDFGSNDGVTRGQIKTAVRKNKWSLIAVGVVVLVVLAVVLA